MRSIAPGEARPDPIRLETLYGPDLRRVKLVMMGAPARLAAVLQAAANLLEAWR